MQLKVVYLIYIPKRAKLMKEISHNSTYLIIRSTVVMEQNMLLFWFVFPKGNIYIFPYILLKFKISSIVKKFGKILGYLHPKIPDI